MNIEREDEHHFVYLSDEGIWLRLDKRDAINYVSHSSSPRLTSFQSTSEAVQILSSAPVCTAPFDKSSLIPIANREVLDPNTHEVRARTARDRFTFYFDVSYQLHQSSWIQNYLNSILDSSGQTKLKRFLMERLIGSSLHRRLILSGPPQSGKTCLKRIIERVFHKACILVHGIENVKKYYHKHASQKCIRLVVVVPKEGESFSRLRRCEDVPVLVVDDQSEHLNAANVLLEPKFNKEKDLFHKIVSHDNVDAFFAWIVS